MDRLYLRPDQIIAMVDYPPLHSPEALDRYYRRFRANADDISPVPVMRTDLVLGAFRHQPDHYASYGQMVVRQRPCGAEPPSVSPPGSEAEGENRALRFRPLRGGASERGAPSQGFRLVHCDAGNHVTQNRRL